jgi:D-amino peptidase
MSAASARDLIHERARNAMQKISQIRPYKIEGPVTFEVEYTTRRTPLPDPGLAPGAEIVDARTIRYRGKDFMEAWIRQRRF